VESRRGEENQTRKFTEKKKSKGGRELVGNDHKLRSFGEEGKKGRCQQGPSRSVPKAFRKNSTDEKICRRIQETIHVMTSKIGEGPEMRGGPGPNDSESLKGQS